MDVFPDLVFSKCSYMYRVVNYLTLRFTANYDSPPFHPCSLQIKPHGVVDGHGQVLFGPQIPLRGLDGCVAEQQLNLLEIPARLAAQFRAGPPIMPHAALPELCRMPDHAESKSQSPRCWLARDHLRRIDSA